MANEQTHTYGTQTTVISQTATVADTEVVGGDTEFDNEAGNNYAMALATLTVTDTFGGAPAGNIALYMVRGEVNTANNDDTALGYAQLDTTDNQTTPEYAELITVFPANVDEAYRLTKVISILGVKKAKFYIQNNTGQTLVYSSNAITVTITPFAMGT